MIIGEKTYGNMKKRPEYKVYKSCRFCFSKKVLTVVDLGVMPLAGGFLTKKSQFKKEKKYPISLLFCKNCYLLQTSISVNPDILFKKDYFYHSSAIKTLVDHFEKTAKQIKRHLRKGSFVMEIGCNDGSFIRAVEKNGFKAVGVDPADNIVKPIIREGLPVVDDYFTEEVAKKILRINGKADAIYSFHTLAHIVDMHDVMRGIKLLLKSEGYLAFEVHYLGTLLRDMQYDMIYHEHLHYYSFLTIEKLLDQYDMEVYNVQRNEVRAGSIFYFVQNKKTGKRKISKKVGNLRKQEIKQKLNTKVPYLEFHKKIQNTKKDLLSILNKLKKKKVQITGYGASGRATVILNYCGLNTNFLEFIVDDASSKQNCFMPGTHNPIYSPSKLFNAKIKYSVVFAWPFINEVKKRNKKYTKSGGKFILPLPKVKLI